MHKLLIIVCASVALLSGCSGNGNLASAGANAGGGSGSGSGSGSGTGTTTVSLGSGTGSSFQPGMIAISTTSLSAGGSTSLQVSLVDQTGALYTTSTIILFSSPCAGQGLATIAATGVTPASSSVTTTTGTASATYVATGCSGSDVITATASANNQTLTASGTVTVAQAAIGSIKFISATPPNITLKGVGSAGGSATSTVVFKVLDTSGGPRAGATVTFALDTSAGGITMSPASAVSDANGQVQTIVSGGTVATTVRVTATTTASGGTTISTQSNNLTVSTGIPTSHNISLAVLCQNVEAWDYDGVPVSVTVSMTDRFHNPVPDNTTANFRTTLSGIQATCQTGSNTPGSGTCAVNWMSKGHDTSFGNPQTTTGNAKASPAYCTGLGLSMGLCNTSTNGRSPLLVTAIGEESFVDKNGNGIFDALDTVAFDPANPDNNFPGGAPKAWQDTSEPFLNEWELFDAYGTPTYVAGEPFIDFNTNGTRDGPDGQFNGPLCTGSYCSPNTSVAIGASDIIVMSGSSANLQVLSPAGGSPYSYNGGNTTVSGSSLSLTVQIFDDRLQQMPAGTKVVATISSGLTASITSPAPAAWPCTSAPPQVVSGVTYAGLQFTFDVAPTTPAPSSGLTTGTLYITVTTPKGLITTFSIPIAP